MKNLIKNITALVTDFINKDNYVVMPKKEFDSFVKNFHTKVNRLKAFSKDRDMIEVDEGGLEEHVKDAVWDSISNLYFDRVKDYVSVGDDISGECEDLGADLRAFENKYSTPVVLKDKEIKKPKLTFHTASGESKTMGE
mgnify:CR=1 FL=1